MDGWQTCWIMLIVLCFYTKTPFSEDCQANYWPSLKWYDFISDGGFNFYLILAKHPAKVRFDLEGIIPIPINTAIHLLPSVLWTTTKTPQTRPNQQRWPTFNIHLQHLWGNSELNDAERLLSAVMAGVPRRGLGHVGWWSRWSRGEKLNEDDNNTSTIYRKSI